MSAWIVSDAHIDALVTFALDKRTRFWNGKEAVYVTCDNAEEIGRLLLDENVASVNHRYDGEIDDEQRNAAAAYRFREFLPAPSPVVILKGCACYEYQACEHDGWNGSVAKAIIEAIHADAMSALPGYDAAPWGIERP